MTQTEMQVIYKLEGVEAEDGVDIFSIAPILMHFGEVIRSANSVLGYDHKIDVKVKPFRQGSWITDFVINRTPVESLLNYLQTQEGNDLMTLLAFLGINVKEGIVSIIDVIRFVKGRVSNFSKSADGTKVTYTAPDGGKLEVSMATHKLVQSPLIQNNYYNSIIVPLEKFPTATAVSLETTGAKAQIIKHEDKLAFDEYAKTTLLEDVEENITKLEGIYLKPKRGSYSGEEKAYSFVMGDSNVLWPVTIDDQIFIKRLTTGEIRLYAEDVLKVNLAIRQKKDATNKVSATYSVVKVVEYIKYERPKQIDLLSKK